MENPAAKGDQILPRKLSTAEELEHVLRSWSSLLRKLRHQPKKLKPQPEAAKGSRQLIAPDEAKSPDEA